jgi:tripeptide aminopeptidase
MADAASRRLADGNTRTLAWQADVTRIAAPTGHESARAAWMAAQFRSIGWTDVRLDVVGNVIARRPRGLDNQGIRDNHDNCDVHDIRDLHDHRGDYGDRGAVWCCAHLDTVFADASPQVVQHGARLTGPGIGDNGRGLAAVLALADALHHAEVFPAREVIFACTVGEEGLGDLRGMKQLLDDATPAPAAVIAIDGAGDDRIVHGAVGSSRWRVMFTGAGGHSWADFGVANPAHAAAAVVTALQAVLLPREPRTTLTVARIGGGESINSIPRSGWIEVDMRSLSASVLADLERTLRETVHRVEKQENSRRLTDTAPLVSTIELLGQRPCGSMPDDAPLVRIAERATRAIGATPRLAVGSTDASIAIARGIPAIAIGAGGRGGGMHTPEEWYDDTRGVRGLERALRILLDAADLRAHTP